MKTMSEIIVNTAYDKSLSIYMLNIEILLFLLLNCGVIAAFRQWPCFFSNGSCSSKLQMLAAHFCFRFFTQPELNSSHISRGDKKYPMSTLIGVFASSSCCRADGVAKRHILTKTVLK